MRVCVEGLSKSPQYNGRLGTIQREVEGSRLCVVLDQDGKVLSLKRENLVEVQREALSRAGKLTAMQHKTCGWKSCGDEQPILMYNMHAPKGFQRRSKIEKGMRLVRQRPGHDQQVCPVWAWWHWQVDTGIYTLFHLHLWFCFFDLCELILETFIDNDMFLDTLTVQHFGIPALLLCIQNAGVHTITTES